MMFVEPTRAFDNLLMWAILNRLIDLDFACNIIHGIKSLSSAPEERLQGVQILISCAKRRG